MKLDADLTNAHRSLVSLDRAIGKLYDRFGDRVDGNGDFIDAEERRFAALECSDYSGQLAGRPGRQGASAQSGVRRRGY